MSIDWPRFVQSVREHQRFVLTSHVKPDCDALGSELGMAGVLEALGKEVRILNADAVPPRLAFIDPQGKIEQLDRDAGASEVAGFDAVFVLDTSAWNQLGAMADVVRSTPAKVLVLDHHVSEDNLGDDVFKDVHAPATGTLVCEAAAQLGVELTVEMARPLFAAMATDTGWFRFGSTRGDTYRLAGRLIDLGVVPGELFCALYEQESLARLHLVGRVLARVKSELDGRLVYTTVLGSDFDQTAALPSDTEDVINRLLAVRGTEVAVMAVEQSEGGVKASFRSRSAVNVSALAEKFGGGGHKAAAGASLEGPCDAALAKVLDAVRAAMQ